jgi:valyl-tRNA synthetase
LSYGPISEKLSLNDGKMLITSPWPKLSKNKIDSQSVGEVQWLINCISSIRTARAELNISPALQLNLIVKDASSNTQKRFSQYEDVIMRLARLIKIDMSAAIPKGAIQTVVGEATLAMPVADIIDLSAERTRLQNQLKKLADDIAKFDAKLGNPNFVEKAAEEAVEEVREKRAEAAETQGKLEQALKSLAS